MTLANTFQAHCAQAPGPIRFQRLTLRANMILDVITDALSKYFSPFLSLLIRLLNDSLVILVPVNLLWKVRLSIRKKFALGGIFSITVIIMIFAIVRVVVVSSRSQQPDQTWLYMWSFIEQGVCMLLSFSIPFRSNHARLNHLNHVLTFASHSGRVYCIIPIIVQEIRTGQTPATS